MEHTEIKIINRREEMPAVVTMVEGFGIAHGTPAQAVNVINLALDEVLSNIISYGYGPEERGEILIRLAHRPGEILVEVEDTGRPFDPIQAPPPELLADLQSRRVGGLGIHFIKSLMDEVRYIRVDGKNRLQLRKKLASG
jgi:anti-sigma regulatory factor (Ser/Thr protein kinase)